MFYFLLEPSAKLQRLQLFSCGSGTSLRLLQSWRAIEWSGCCCPHKQILDRPPRKVELPWNWRRQPTMNLRNGRSLKFFATGRKRSTCGSFTTYVLEKHFPPIEFVCSRTCNRVSALFACFFKGRHNAQRGLSLFLSVRNCPNT